MTSIQANRIFSLVPERGPERVAHVRIPLRRDPEVADYSLLLLETYVLIALMRITKAQKVFEFGTFLGNTALNLALNTDATIYTLDLDHEAAKTLTTDRPADHIALDFRMDHYQMEWEGFPPEVVGRIVPLIGDSTKFDFSPYANSMDLIWLDGGRSYECVRSDYASAVMMLRDSKCSAIGWHDYQGEHCPELTEFLNELVDRGLPLYHVRGTAMALYLNWEPLNWGSGW